MICVEYDQDGRPERVALSDEWLRIGSAADNHVVLADERVSRHHLMVRLVGEQVEVQDVGSTNGTFLDSKPVSSTIRTPPFELVLGEVVRIRLSDGPTDDILLADAIPSAGLDGLPAGREDETASDGPTTAAPPHAAALTRALLESLLSGMDPTTALQGVARAARAAVGGRWSLILDFGSELDAEPVATCIGELDVETKQVVTLGRRHLESGDRTSRSRELGQAVQLVTAARPRAQRVLILPSSPLSTVECDLLGTALASAPGRPMDPADDERRAAYSLSGMGMVDGTSELSRSLNETISHALTSDLPILLTGPTGTGKEVHARAIHAHSGRKDGPFVAVNSSALPEALAESMLFGTVAGAATGVTAQAGLLREASGGTFFLDEVGEMSSATQAKLLRVLDEGLVLPVGATKPVPIDVRFIAATNRDLDAAVRDGSFREDLLHRLRGHEFCLPLLRNRAEDIPLLVSHFVELECQATGRAVRGFTLAAVRALQDHAWPGNVRELRSTIRSLVHQVPSGSVVREANVLSALRQPAGSRGRDLRARESALQKEAVAEALARHDGNKTRAARELGLSRTGLRNLMKRLGLS